MREGAVLTHIFLMVDSGKSAIAPMALFYSQPIPLPSILYSAIICISIGRAQVILSMILMRG